MAQANLILLSGHDLIAKQREVEQTGFTDTLKHVLQKLLDGQASQITRVEVQYLLNKIV